VGTRRRRVPSPSVRPLHDRTGSHDQRRVRGGGLQSADASTRGPDRRWSGGVPADDPARRRLQRPARGVGHADLHLLEGARSGGGVTGGTVDGKAARGQRRGAELVVTPAAPVPAGGSFTVDVEGFTATPVTSSDAAQGKAALLRTPDGTALAGQPAAMHTFF